MPGCSTLVCFICSRLCSSFCCLCAEMYFMQKLSLSAGVSLSDAIAYTRRSIQVVDIMMI